MKHEYAIQIIINTSAAVLATVIINLGSLIFQFKNNEYAVIIIEVVVFLIFIAINCILHSYKCKKCNTALSMKKNLQTYNEVGVIDIAPSTTKGKGSTENILSECDNNFFFMGIAATKWIKDAHNFDEVMKKLLMCNGSVRIIMLNPMCESAKHLSTALGKAEEYLKESVLKNMRELREYKKMGLNIEIKVYSHMPVFRIAIIDNQKIYVGHYRVNDNGEKLPQLILQGKNKILFKQFFDYWNVTWNDVGLKTINLDMIDNEEYIKKLYDRR